MFLRKLNTLKMLSFNRAAYSSSFVLDFLHSGNKKALHPLLCLQVMHWCGSSAIAAVRWKPFLFFFFLAYRLCEQFTGCILGLGTAEACHHLQAVSQAVLGLEESRYSLPWAGKSMPEKHSNDVIHNFLFSLSQPLYVACWYFVNIISFVSCCSLSSQYIS
jgi:hypothetical protein